MINKQKDENLRKVEEKYENVFSIRSKTIERIVEELLKREFHYSDIFPEHPNLSFSNNDYNPWIYITDSYLRLDYRTKNLDRKNKKGLIRKANMFREYMEEIANIENGIFFPVYLTVNGKLYKRKKQEKRILNKFREYLMYNV